MPSALVGPLRWISAIIVLGVFVWVVTPLALDAITSSVQFGEEPTEAASPATPSPAPRDQAAGDGEDEGEGDGGQTEPPADAATPTPDPDPTATPTPVETEPEFDTYIVEGGDTLNSIADEVYGDSTLWTIIQEANGIENPAALVVGQELQIPPEP